ncbi:MAG TPA: hypothetical protein VGU73_00590, partial [Acidimicrobiia bacterium]|nr:hypothetical protein [Acidimicrobiia bacterium]
MKASTPPLDPAEGAELAARRSPVDADTDGSGVPLVGGVPVVCPGAHDADVPVPTTPTPLPHTLTCPLGGLAAFDGEVCWTEHVEVVPVPTTPAPLPHTSPWPTGETSSTPGPVPLVFALWWSAQVLVVPV